jgi:membrane protein implicated in regulation of membrane protease activity
MSEWLTPAVFWWIAAGVAVAAELVTGTFYLLMAALGLAAAGITAYFGGGFSAQLIVAALVGGGAVAGWHRKRASQPKGPAAAFNPDVNIDVGQRVHVAHWKTDGTARVTYRGANWSVRWSGDEPPAPGDYVIRAVQGNELLLGR